MTQLLFLTQSGPTLPSVRFRVLPFVEQALARGIDARWQRYPKTAFARAAFFARLPKTHTIVLQKKLVSSLELSLLKRKCDRLVFDFDDALWAKHPNQGECGGMTDDAELERLRRVCAGVDVVVAGNSFLAGKVRDVAKRVEILPTPLNTDFYVPSEVASDGKPVVGWMGTGCNLFFLPEIFDGMKDIAADFGVSVISDEEYPVAPPFSGSFDFWAPDLELSQLQAMDIGLMPLTDDEYTRGKCGFKLLQYMACGAVPIASDVGFNREIISHGEDGFLVNDAKGFAQSVAILASDESLRKKMSVLARKKVVERFSLNAAADSLFSFLPF